LRRDVASNRFECPTIARRRLAGINAGQLMMVQTLLIGVGAGVASALLFASPASGAALAPLLLIIAPLPILIAAIGWSHWAGLIAIAAAAVALMVITGTPSVQSALLPFILGIGFPAWLLGYFALLARSDPSGDGLLWYPVGTLVLWSAVLSAGTTLSIIPFYGWDVETFRGNLRALFEAALLGEKGSGGATSDTARFIDFLVTITPPVAAALGTVTNMFNLWLAARVLAISGRLRRPWPELPAMRLPAAAPALLVAAWAASLAGGMLGLAANAVAWAVLVAHAIVGLAVVHAITRGQPARAGILIALYAGLPVFAFLQIPRWPLLALAAIAVIDFGFDLRGRAASHPPPAIRE
jgi:Predicted membrane protein (DUF2232)